MFRITRPLGFASLLFAASCAPQIPDEGSEWVDTGDLSEGLNVTCGSAQICSGEGAIYASTYRVGTSELTRGEFLQTFVAPLAGAPSSVRLSVRPLRAFTVPSGDGPHLRVAISAVTGTATNPVLSGAPIAEGSVPLTTVPTNGPVDVALSGEGALESGTTYALVVSADAVTAGGSGSTLVGIGSLIATPYAGGRAANRSLRRASSSAGWGQSRFRPSADWDVAFALTLVTSPGAPTNVTAEAGDAMASVSWTAPAFTGGGPVTSYTVQASPGGAQQVVSAPATSVAFTGLTNETAYTFTVTATNGFGAGPASASSDPVTPTCPTGYAWNGSACEVHCGDGLIFAPETCDDHDAIGGDGCSSSCQVEPGYTCVGQPSFCWVACSDGLIGPGEQCDDGGSSSGDGCSSSCQVEPGYDCVGTPSACVAHCSDGLIVGGEQCDDAGTTAGDGCSASCQVEPGYTCVGTPSACSTSCGDGVRAGAEGCDDGNPTTTDGCAGCVVQPGYSCTGSAPSVCGDVNECTANTHGCTAHGTCVNSPGSYSCACQVGWVGATCDACAAGYGGASCSACPGGAATPCTGHGTCGQGVSGSGLCSCNVGWTSAACNSCAAGYGGPSCAACPGGASNPCSGHGTCSEGTGGTGTCTCTGSWVGADCSVDLGSASAPATSCQALYLAGKSSGPYYLHPTGNPSGARYMYCQMGYGGGWMLVARLAGSGGFPGWNSDLQPGYASGTYAANLTTNANYYTSWSEFPYSEFLFRTTDGAVWLVTHKSNFATYYANDPRAVSSWNGGGATAFRWYFRGPPNPEDPWVSVGDHVGQIVFGENGFSASPHNDNKNAHGGVGVFVK